MRAFLTVVLFCAAAHLQAQELKDRTDVVEAKLLDIKLELTKIADHPWAGEYYTGDFVGLNRRLYIAPDTGLVYQSVGCGGINDQNVGSIEKKGCEIHVTWKWNELGHYREGTTFIPIQWGTALYLVPQHEILEFCIEARLGQTLVIGQPYRRVVGTDGKPWGEPSGKPQLPEAYEKYRSLDHVRAKIVKVSPPSISIVDGLEKTEQTFTVDAGRKAGLFPNTIVYIPAPKGKQHYSCTVASADENSAIVKATSILHPGQEPFSLKPRKRVTTKRS